VRKKVLLFGSAFLLGYLALASSGSRLTVVAPPIASRSTAASHGAQAFSEYEALMLDDSEKNQLRLDQANTLNALLGLAEKKWSDGEGNENLMQDVAAKLAKRYPAQALRYYASYPTNAKMNEGMLLWIREAWSRLDMPACLSNLDRDTTFSTRGFCNTWLNMLGGSSGKSADFVQSFTTLNREKQKVLMSDLNSSDSIVAALVPVIKDPEVLAEAKKILQAASEQKQTDPGVKSRSQIERDRMDTMLRDFKAVKPEPAQVVKILEAEKSEYNRSQILQAILCPGEDEEKDATVWLGRVSVVLAWVQVTPDYPPVSSQKGGYDHQKELEQWLPAQSPKLQRAWADNLISQKPADEALEWIEQLSTASLRADMREQVMKELTTNNPQSASEYIITKGLIDEQENLLPQAVYQWALRDYAAARQWLSAQHDTPAKAAAVKMLDEKARH
jgi:hypothetical protein